MFSSLANRRAIFFTVLFAQLLTRGYAAPGFRIKGAIMPEYVRVVFPDQRDVFVDGDKMGRTNRKFRIGRGTYVFDLGDPQDYAPASRTKTIKNTTEDEPLEVPFEKA
jgi:hypothetical protein